MEEDAISFNHVALDFLWFHKLFHFLCRCRVEIMQRPLDLIRTDPDWSGVGEVGVMDLGGSVVLGVVASVGFVLDGQRHALNRSKCQRRYL